MSLDKKILEIRKENNLTQEEFADILNISRQTVSNWENFRCYPDIETLILISDKFNVSLDILLKEDKEMAKNIDKKVKDNKKLKILVFGLIIVLLISSVTFFVKAWIRQEQERKDDLRYKEIMNNIKILGFNERDGIGFSEIVEDDVTYKIYVKMPLVLEGSISASTEWTDEEAIIVDYDGKRATVSYLNEDVTTVYCDKDGYLVNDKVNINHTKIYEKYKDRTIKIVTRMVELFDEIYK